MTATRSPPEDATPKRKSRKLDRLGAIFDKRIPFAPYPHVSPLAQAFLFAAILSRTDDPTGDIPVDYYPSLPTLGAYICPKQTLRTLDALQAQGFIEYRRERGRIVVRILPAGLAALDVSRNDGKKRRASSTGDQGPAVHGSGTSGPQTRDQRSTDQGPAVHRPGTSDPRTRDQRSRPSSSIPLDPSRRESRHTIQPTVDRAVQEVWAAYVNGWEAADIDGPCPGLTSERIAQIQEGLSARAAMLGPDGAAFGEAEAVRTLQDAARGIWHSRWHMDNGQTEIKHAVKETNLERFAAEGARIRAQHERKAAEDARKAELAERQRRESQARAARWERENGPRLKHSPECTKAEREACERASKGMEQFAALSYQRSAAGQAVALQAARAVIAAELATDKGALVPWEDTQWDPPEPIALSPDACRALAPLYADPAPDDWQSKALRIVRDALAKQGQDPERFVAWDGVSPVAAPEPSLSRPQPKWN